MPVEEANPQTQAESQPQPAGDGLDRFRGGSSEAVSTAETEHPEPAAGEAAETSTPADSVTGEAEQIEGAEEEGAAEEALPRWLEDLELSPEEMADYRKRYPAAFAAEAPEDLRYLLRDKVKSDRLVQERIAEQAEGEPTSEAAEPATTTDAARLQQQYYAQIDNLVRTTVNPEAMSRLGLELLSSFGVDTNRVDDPNIRELVQNAPRVGGTLARAAIDLVATVLPSLQQQALEAVFPGFGEMYQRSVFALQWDKVRQSDEVFARLPEYGTAEFRSVMRKAAETLPGFDDMVFRGKNGRVLPMHEQAARKYSILAKIASGQPVNPAVVKEAIETGRRQANEANSKRAAGKALGAGQGRPSGAATETDPLMAAIADDNAGFHITGQK